MEIKATRTLVKSQPELWELLDDEPQLRYWCEQLGEPGSEIEVTVREPGRRIAWRGSGEPAAAVEVTLAEKGFGTRVVIRAEAESGLAADGLEQILDELSEPQRRPFSAA
jgi:uncharacterized protein YndB with AHSA1/START domain